MFAVLSQRDEESPLAEIAEQLSRHPVIVTHFEGLTDSASFEVISDYETYEVLKIYGGGR